LAEKGGAYPRHSRRDDSDGDDTASGTIPTEYQSKRTPPGRLTEFDRLMTEGGIEAILAELKLFDVEKPQLTPLPK
jgi:hypothetical protein